jgi:hypothetical protein
MVEMLLRHNADAGVTDAFGYTALMLAANLGYIEIVEILRLHADSVKFDGKAKHCVVAHKTAVSLATDSAPDDSKTPDI